MVGGIQIRADAPPQDTESALFRGCTAQMENLLNPDGTPTGTGTLGASVGTNSMGSSITGVRVRWRSSPR